MITTPVRSRHALTPAGWQSNIVLEITPDGRIGTLRHEPSLSAYDVDLLLPAAANLHSHSFQRALAGLTEARSAGRDSFWSWRSLMYRFLEQLGPEQLEAIAAMVFVEMLEAGYASVGEFHYLHHQPDGQPYAFGPELSARIVRAAHRTGIGLTLLPVLYQYGGCDRRPLQGGQLRFRHTPDRFARLHEDLQALFREAPADFRLGVAPHSLRAVDREGLALAQELCPAGPLHLHLAEQEAEVTEVLACHGARPVEWLLAQFPVDERWCLVHCTQMTPTETRMLAATGAIAGICPLTEASLGDGIFNGSTYLEAGGRIGVGTDSNIEVGYFGELKMLEYSQRLQERGRAILADPARSTGRRLVEETLAGGAQALGRPAARLTAGGLADMVGLTLDHHLLERPPGQVLDDSCLDTLVFAGIGDACVQEVWSAGRHVVTNGQHINRHAVEQGYRQAIRSLKSAM
ncbi:MAG: formimidoylglutamate deiminase [Thiothrix sp.]|nr:formimidoylglutamate deiminase [Thiothrix sp.]HPQ96364.1 formimidoylglutamate deiminase [Thiolinea sp.]